MNLKNIIPYKLYEFLKVSYHGINRLKSPVECIDISIEPVSRKFGMDRGMPIDRFYIEEFLKSNKAYIRGDLLEIAEATYSNKFGDKGSNKYVLSYDGSGEGAKEKIIVCDLTELKSVPEGIVDCFICTQTLNFVYDVKAAIRGIKKILRPGGVALVTVSGLSQISKYDYNRWGDYWRFSDMCIRKLFTETFLDEKVSVFPYGNLASCTALLKGIAVEDLENSSVLQNKDKDYQCIIGVVAIKE